MPEQSGGKDHECEFDFGGSESEAPPSQTGLWNVDWCSERGLGWQLSWEVPSPASGEGVWGEEAVPGMEPGGTSMVKGRIGEQEPVKETEWSKHREEGKGVWCQGSRREVSRREWLVKSAQSHHGGRERKRATGSCHREALSMSPES